jgi:putative ABC transport system permease protein
VIFGLVPSLGASRPDLIRMLRASGETGNQGLSRGTLAGLNVRGLLLVVQVALSIVLLIGAALLMESVSHLRRVDVGFNPSHLLTMQISLPPLRYDTDQKKAAFFQELLRQMGSSPGVRSATAAMFLPMMGYAGTPVQDAGKPPLKLNERPIATISTVTPGYFRTLEISLRRGREFTERDTADAQRVAIVDEALARRFWPAYPAGQDPVGQRILIGGVNPKPVEIVGIAADVHQNLENSAWPESVYVSFAQNPQPFAMLAIRTAGDPLRFTRAVREQVHALDPDQSIATVRTMDDLVEAQVGQRRLLVILLGSFAGMALLLALIGIYGTVAYSVAQRTQEVGIRRALGAQQSDILRLVVGEGFRLALVGVAFGITGAFGLTRLMRTLLFHVSTTDPATFAGIALLFLLVALAASYIPARRATRIDPIAALRI